MSAILVQVLTAILDELVNVQTGRRPGAAHHDPIVVTDDHARPIAVFDQAGGDDANHPAVPTLSPHDVDVLEFLPVRKLSDGISGDLLVVRAPDLVEPVQVARQLFGPGVAFFGQQAPPPLWRSDISRQH